MNIYGQCSPPTLVQVVESSSEHLILSWLYFDDADGYELELVPLGSSPTLQPTTPLITQKTYSFLDLTPATAYTIFIRTVCTENNVSEWNPVSVRTQIPQPSPCLFTLPIKNNNCSQGLESFDIAVTDTDGILGEDVFLSSVDLILEHTWPADLDIRLVSPSGKETILSQNNGTVTDNFGNISSNDCSEHTRFSDLACIPINHSSPPYLGSILPENPLYQLEDKSSANGIWSLKICDRSIQDIGLLKYFNLNFEPLLCELPRDILVKSINATTVEVVWEPFEGCSGTEIDLSLAGSPQGSINTTIINCETGTITIENLEPGTDYEIYITSNCSGIQSPSSCPFNFTTACTEVTDVESFDRHELCTSGCSFDCEFVSSWFNTQEDEQDWIIWHDKTNTDDTGPSEGVFDGGNYLYIESSPDICSPRATARLESSCYEILSNEMHCDFSFWYHMHGEDMGSLSLLAFANESPLADTLFSISGNQEDKWINRIISLDRYAGMAVTFMFVGTTGDGPRSDIALDQIELRGSIIRPEGFVYYQDIDLDGYGNAAFPINICNTNPSPNFVSNSEDCNDNDPSISPLATEIPCNNIDENCNGQDDDNPIGNTLNYEITAINDNCSNKGSGSITLENITGNPPFTFLWNTGDTSNNISNLNAGVYRCSITDGTNCTIETDDIFIGEDSEIDLNLTEILMASCSGKGDGKISVQGLNGLSPYSYNWITLDIINDGIIENITAGIYKVIATDANGCNSDTIEIEVVAQGEIEGDISFQLDVRCHGGNNGILKVDAISGTSPYSFDWNTGDTTSMIEDLTADLYSCTVTDKVGCQAVVFGEISEPDSMVSIIVSQENIDCFGENTGSINTDVIGGFPPYTFAWNTGEQSDDIFDLTKGKYQLTITDANACIVTSDTVTLTEPEELHVSVDSALAAECILSHDGYLSVEVKGGDENYNYFWSTNTQDTFALEGIPAGVYSVTVTDQNNCKATLSNYELNATSRPIAVDLMIAQDNICHNDSIGIIVANISHGHTPIDYNWSAGVNRVNNNLTDSLISLPAGTYKLSVTDAEGCIGVSDTIRLEEIPEIQFEILENIDNICFDDTLGLIEIDVLSGGVPPFQFQWSNGDTITKIENLATDKYKVTITDSNNCSFESQNISINSNPPIEVTYEIRDATGPNADGRIELYISGGTPLYSIIWRDNIADANSLIAENLVAGEYQVTIIDNDECEITLDITLDMTNGINQNEFSFNIHPNPTNSRLYIESEISLLKIELYDVKGRIIKSFQPDALLYSIDFQSFQSGVYVVKIISKRGIASRLITKL